MKLKFYPITDLSIIKKLEIEPKEKAPLSIVFGYNYLVAYLDNSNTSGGYPCLEFTVACYDDDEEFQDSFGFVSDYLQDGNDKTIMAYAPLHQIGSWGDYFESMAEIADMNKDEWEAVTWQEQ